MKRINLIRNQLSQSQFWSLQLTEGNEFHSVGTLKGKTVLITGASRGIGLAIGLRCAKDGANVAILAKSVNEDERLGGTIFSAAEQINNAGGRGLPVQCDIRSEESVQAAILKTVETFGGIDIVINNASAISLTDTENTNMKKYDLMNQVNTRGTFMVSKYAIPYLKKSSNGHILNISPPIKAIQAKWFKDHAAYSIAKFGMSLNALGMAAELKEFGVAVNCLWPKTSIDTAAVRNLLGGKGAVSLSRTTDIMSDSAYVILTSDSKKTTGNFFIDDEVLASVGVTDFEKYNVDKGVKQDQLMPDFFI